MNTFLSTPSRIASVILLAATPVLKSQWTAPTPEELSMTSIKEVPGAPAVYLFKEEIAIDSMHMQSFYVRVKVLTEGGKDYATVQLPYLSGASGLNVDSVAGRTIHPDGTIVPYTGKPYEKLIEKGSDYKVKMKVFSLPAVEVGSIIEYRYKIHIDDHYFVPPDWIIQTDLFTRKAHYMWQPTDRELVDEQGKVLQSQAAWSPLLPAGATVKQSQVQSISNNNGGDLQAQIELDVHDIPPIPKEEFMPPMRSLAYKVLFYYTPYKSVKDYWTAEGKRWAKARDKFIGPGPAVQAAVKDIILPDDTQEQKLRKLYASVMRMENTDFTREHLSSEDRAEGLSNISSTDDILKRKLGNGDQLTLTFIAMARAAGFKAYLMGIADRRERLFVPGYLTLRQLDDDIAIVELNGKEMYFDPGQRYTSFGHLSWGHAFSGGLREVEGGSVELANTPASSFKDTMLSRIADLTLDERGEATGTVSLKYTGDAALDIRQLALRGDETSLHKALRERLERQLPGGMEIKVVKVSNLIYPEMPLEIKYEVKGAIGSATGKRLLVPANLFETNVKPRFPETKRDLPIDMRYPSAVQDAVRLTFPPSLMVESAPAASAEQMANAAAFDMKSKVAPNSITLYRNLTLGKTMFPSTSYTDLRAFYGKLESRDQETVVLTHGDGSAAKPAPTGFIEEAEPHNLDPSGAASDCCRESR